MVAAVCFCCVLVLGTTVLHYEVLRMLNARLPQLRIPDRLKLVVVILGTFVAHAAEMLLYGAALYVLIAWFDAGQLVGSADPLWVTTLYFSAQTYTSLGFGDISPTGPIRLIAGIESLNGLLLIGWSASFTYIAMERFWKVPPSSATAE